MKESTWSSYLGRWSCERNVEVEVSELKIRERPPSMLKNVDGGPPSGC
jgi:hypothetical protein